MNIAGLLSDEGRALMESLPPYDPANTRLITELRRHHSPELVSAALTQQRLRQKAVTKFGDDAAHLFFTEDGLQQATRSIVAAHHARRYVDAGIDHVWDLGCGIGAESLAFARAGLAVTAVELDEATASIARANLEPLGVQVINADAAEVAEMIPSGDGIFADPARRGGRGRIFDPQAYSPPLDTVLSWRRHSPALGIKIAPGIGYDYLSDAHAQWVSVDGDVVEAGLWYGLLADGPGRSALVIRGDQNETLTVTDDSTSPAAASDVSPLDEFIIEPDGAVIRAGGVATIAEALSGGVVSESIAYITAPQPYTGLLAESFRVIDTMTVKQLKGWLSAHSVGRVEIKKRGIDVDIPNFRRGLKLRGDNEATVILTRLQGRHSAVVVERV